MDILFGGVERTEILDEEGSTKTMHQKLRDGFSQKPIRVRYEIRHRTDKTDLETISNIARTLLNDFSKLDAELKLERSKTGEQDGYYHLVECYTVLEY
jgi:hypothetical protein